ncbi:MAG TPA: PE-PPE domain-containing protein [Mycobacterium sp.]|nr:PE-PPE domain-containing protein [Mycobacterium sp.]
MKKMILGAVLCGCAVALAGAANADQNGNFLFGSTDALIMGPTGVPTPDAAYVHAAQTLYLDPNGYGGTAATTLPFTTPETYEFLPSVNQGVKDLVDKVVTDYNAGEMNCSDSGICGDPLTIFGYSQSSAIIALAEPQLAAQNIPSDALRFVMLGANPAGTPDDFYPTAVYNINGDFWADPTSIGANPTPQDLLAALILHFTYLGLTPAEIDSATPVVEGMTTVFNIPTLTLDEVWEALFRALLAS